MYLIVIAWTYVTLMMAVAEATSPVGSVLGAVITFVLYGVLPMSILVYILSTPARKRAIKAREAAEQAAYDEQHGQQHGEHGDPGKQTEQVQPAAPTHSGVSAEQDAHTKTHSTPGLAATDSIAPDAGGKTPAAAQSHTVAPVRKEP